MTFRLYLFDLTCLTPPCGPHTTRDTARVPRSLRPARVVRHIICVPRYAPHPACVARMTRTAHDASCTRRAPRAMRGAMNVPFAALCVDRLHSLCRNLPLHPPHAAPALLSFCHRFPPASAPHPVLSLSTSSFLPLTSLSALVLVCPPSSAILALCFPFSPSLSHFAHYSVYHHYYHPAYAVPPVLQTTSPKPIKVSSYFFSCRITLVCLLC